MLHRNLFLIYFIILTNYHIKAQEASISDTSLWIKTPLKFVSASVKLPYTSTLEKKDVYTAKGLQSLYYLKAEHKALELSFTASMRQVSAKEYKKALQEEINRLAVQFGGYPTTYKEKDKNGLSYEYVLIYLSDRKTIFSRIYFIDDYLVMLTGIAPEKDKYNNIVQFFLNSMIYKKTNSTVVNQKSKNAKSKNKSSKSKSKKTPEWYQYNDSSFIAKFPAEPNIKKYYIQNNSIESYLVNNYYFQYSEDNSAYLISERKYDFALGISSDSLFNLAIQTLTKEQKSKILSEQYLYAYQFPTKEYIFSSRKVYYRLRYYFANNTLYQILYSGSKQQVYDLKNEQFFSNFTIK